MIDQETIIRGGFFLGGFIIFVVLQWIIPSRKFEKNRWKFALSNLGLVAVNNWMLILLPIIPYQAAVTAKENGIGIFNLTKDFGLMTSLDNAVLGIVIIALQIAILDIAIYFQHRMFHHVDFLWRFHSMHHIDPMLDVTSGLRFHPIEIIISNFVKVGVILIMGITPMAVVIFEISLNFLAMFNHSNIRLPQWLERPISMILITPALHTIHHSKKRTETNSNYGFSVPWWDKLFGTFIAEGTKSQENIDIGTVPMPDQSLILFPGMLIYPFKKR